MSSFQILVVGELGPFQSALAQWFREWGYDARFAADPPAAHRVCSEWMPNVVLVDHLRVPRDISVWWHQLRDHPHILDVPTIVTGAYLDPQDQASVAAVLHQPYTQAELGAVLQRIRESTG